MSGRRRGDRPQAGAAKMFVRPATARSDPGREGERGSEETGEIARSRGRMAGWLAFPRHRERRGWTPAEGEKSGREAGRDINRGGRGSSFRQSGSVISCVRFPSSGPELGTIRSIGPFLRFLPTYLLHSTRGGWAPGGRTEPSRLRRTSGRREVRPENRQTDRQASGRRWTPRRRETGG